MMNNNYYKNCLTTVLVSLLNIMICFMKFQALFTTLLLVMTQCLISKLKMQFSYILNLNIKGILKSVKIMRAN